MALYGDSIAYGCNASSLADDVQPHLPPWGEMVAEGLREHYGAEVEFLNPSVGGKKSDWGAAHAQELVACHEPDFVMIAFGMNDGSLQVPPEEYRENIRSIIHTVREANPDAEFLPGLHTAAEPRGGYEQGAELLGGAGELPAGASQAVRGGKSRAC